MKVLICGSRDWSAPLTSDALTDRLNALPADAEIITGGAPGADFWAEKWARWSGRPVRVFKADWKRHGKKAGPLRNREMLNERPDLVLAFKAKLESRGTQDTIDEARRRGIPVEVIGPDWVAA